MMKAEILNVLEDIRTTLVVLNVYIIVLIGIVFVILVRGIK